MVNRLWDVEREALRLVLRGFRENNSLTQAGLSKTLGKPQSYVSKYESGERKLDFIEVLKICEALNVSMQELLERYAQQSELLSK